jgi:hypothetical protein
MCYAFNSQPVSADETDRIIPEAGCIPKESTVTVTSEDAVKVAAEKYKSDPPAT